MNHLPECINNHIVGAFLALLIAIWVYKRERNDEFKEILQYMLRLIEGEITQIKDDVRNLKKFTADIISKPWKMHVLTQNPSYDATRLVERIDQYRCLIASEKRGISVDKFKELYSALDYHHAVRNEIKNLLDKVEKFNSEQEKELITITDYLQKQINNYWTHLGEELPDEIQNVYKKVMPDNGEKKYMNDWNENFIIPLKDYFTAHANPNRNNWLWEISRFRALYSEMEEKNKMWAKAFDEYRIGLEQVTGIIEAYQRTLRNKLPANIKST